MASTKLKHLEAKLKILISQILFEEINNPKINQATVTEVKLTSDLSNAKVYVTFSAYPEQSLHALQQLGSTIRKKVAGNFDARKCPYLEFVLDDLLDKINELDKTFEKIKANEIEAVSNKTSKKTSSKTSTTKKAKAPAKKVVKKASTTKKTSKSKK